MKRNLDFMLLLVFLLLAGTGFVSCSSDDDESGTEIEHPEDNLPNEAKAFVGYWSTSENAPDFVFFGDGVCWRLDEYAKCQEKGYWTYDATTKILATTTSGWQWQVTLSNRDSWAGLSLNKSKTMSYNKKTRMYDYLNMILEEASTWEEMSDSTICLGEKSLGWYANRHPSQQGRVWYFTSTISTIRNLIRNLYSEDNCLGLYIMEEDENEADNVLRYKIYPCGSYRYYGTYTYYYSNVPKGEGTIELKNPTSSTNQILVFDGIIKGTFKKSK
ncbi:MAG: hypothetical protein LUD00_00035 [Prevotellaceae bacterium]|nr:hypothetical protein [Prevotellaceae bacterium]